MAVMSFNQGERFKCLKIGLLAKPIERIKALLAGKSIHHGHKQWTLMRGHSEAESAGREAFEAGGIHRDQGIQMLNRSIHRALRDYLKKESLGDDDCLFLSRKGGFPLSVSTVNAMVKGDQPSWQLRNTHAPEDLRLHPENKAWCWI